MASGLAAVILAGGQARRMGGGDKALLSVGGRTILARTLAVLAPHPVALNANGDPARFAPYGLPVLPDALPGHPGPLAGILAAMRWAADRGHPHVLTVPGDCPFLPADLMTRLHAAAGDGIAMAASAGRTHFTTALWPTRLHDDLHAALHAGQRRVAAYAAAHAVAAVDWPTVPADPFLNVNTTADLAEAGRLAVSPPSATAPAGAGPPMPPRG